MTDKPFWSRIKDARLFQVIVIYLAASWLVLQVVGLFIGTMGLPRWTMPWTLVLLGGGLVIVLATAWIQSHPLMPRIVPPVPRFAEGDLTFFSRAREGQKTSESRASSNSTLGVLFRPGQATLQVDYD